MFQVFSQALANGFFTWVCAKVLGFSPNTKILQLRRGVSATAVQDWVNTPAASSARRRHSPPVSRRLQTQLLFVLLKRDQQSVNQNSASYLCTEATAMLRVLRSTWFLSAWCVILFSHPSTDLNLNNTTMVYKTHLQLVGATTVCSTRSHIPDSACNRELDYWSDFWKSYWLYNKCWVWI